MHPFAFAFLLFVLCCCLSSWQHSLLSGEGSEFSKLCVFMATTVVMTILLIWFSGLAGWTVYTNYLLAPLLLLVLPIRAIQQWHQSPLQGF